MANNETTDFYRGKLPHWEVSHGTYFVTLHVAGSLPREVAAHIRKLAREARHAEPTALIAARRRMFVAMERALDRGDGRDLLTQPAAAKGIMDAIHCREKSGVWIAGEFVVMPNHLHMLLQITEGSLREAMLSFKRWTGRICCEALAIERRPFWQREWFDHWLRSPREEERIRAYIQRNPVKAGLAERFADWPYGSWSTGHQETSED